MALTFNRKFDPRYGTAVAVAPQVKRIVCANAGPFTFTGTNSYVIGGDSVVILDPGPADRNHLAALTAAVGGRTVLAICVTHTHADHSPAARILREHTGAPIVGAGAHRPARPLIPGEINALDAATDHDHQPDTKLGDGDSIAGDGWSLAAIATPGHTANHLAFALESNTGATRADVLFSGDHVMGWSTSIVAPPDGSMADYMASLHKLGGRSEGQYLPGHGPAIDDPATYVEALIAHRLGRERAIVEGIHAGLSDISQIVADLYRGIDPNLKGAAALSVLAHIEDLVDRGLVACDEPPTLGSRYEPVSPSPA